MKKLACLMLCLVGCCGNEVTPAGKSRIQRTVLQDGSQSVIHYVVDGHDYLVFTKGERGITVVHVPKKGTP
jgi:hypothetical protein